VRPTAPRPPRSPIGSASADPIRTPSHPGHRRMDSPLVLQCMPDQPTGATLRRPAGSLRSSARAPGARPAPRWIRSPSQPRRSGRAAGKDRTLTRWNGGARSPHRLRTRRPGWRRCRYAAGAPEPGALGGRVAACASRSARAAVLPDQAGESPTRSAARSHGPPPASSATRCRRPRRPKDVSAPRTRYWPASPTDKRLSSG
jgi:hypothetical protein